MDSQHAIGHFKNSEGKFHVVKYYTDEEILSQEHTEQAPIELLRELRWPQYREKLIHVNTVLVKKVIAESVSTDTHIIQSINAVEELDKVCNTLVKRIREWYGYYYPEMEHEISDNELFIKKILQETKSENMTARNIEVSMGPDIDPKDLDRILEFARQVDDLYSEREKLILYIDNTMMAYCPNVYSLTGGLIGAKLLEKAKSLKHLAYLPSSTVQLLGAEKALFRHLRNKKIRPPKHGLILSHPMVMDAKRADRGTAARMFAAKISIAARVDYFKGEFIGDTLREELEKQLK
ncbi:MAG: NOP5/NOP56 family protein [Candidatus Woesearchaeota archaeon]